MPADISNKERDLLAFAEEVAAKAYAPYSRFRVGAAILDNKGEVHLGCNVENAAYPEGCCAEAIAIGAMVSRGKQSIASIAVFGADAVDGPCTPCGGCRQKIAEFANAKTKIIAGRPDHAAVVYSLEDLLPEHFSSANLQTAKAQND
ncbi:MAG: cytidine deaminase [Pseudomonadota bacterium]